MGLTKIELSAEYCDVIKKLPNEDAGQLAKHIFRYASGVELLPISKVAEIAFISLFKRDIDKQLKRVGKNHWNWKGGVSAQSKLIRNGSQIKEWRTAVFVRDEYTCQHCHVKGGNIHAHHIRPFAKYPKLRFEVSNGITLCKACHIAEHKRLRKEGLDG